MGSFVSSALDFNKATLTGALDIIAVRYDDGSLRVTPFHVRFGKLKLLRSRDKLVRVLVDQARREAELLTAETRKGLSEMLERRTKLAEEKIARAEAQAMAEVRSMAVDTAVAAAERLMQAKLTPDAGAQMIDQGIRELKTRLN